MPMHFWIGSGATIAAAAAMGLGLGIYVTSPQPPARAVADSEWDNLDAAPPQTPQIVEAGPTVIRCTGCGPTLEERRMAADMAGLDADGMVGESRDPLVKDYLAQEEVPVESATLGDPPLPPPTVRIHRPSPPARFAASEPAAQPVAMPVAGAVPPPSVPAEPAEAGLPR